MSLIDFASWNTMGGFTLWESTERFHKDGAIILGPRLGLELELLQYAGFLEYIMSAVTFVKYERALCPGGNWDGKIHPAVLRPCGRQICLANLIKQSAVGNTQS